MKFTLSLEILVSIFFIILISIILIYILAKKLSTLGLKNKDTRNKSVLEFYLKSHLEHWKKYWVFKILVISLLIFLIFEYNQNKPSTEIILFTIGICLFLIGIYRLNLDYNKNNLVTTSPDYKFWKETGNEEFAKKFNKISNIILIILAVITICISIWLILFVK